MQNQRVSLVLSLVSLLVGCERGVTLEMPAPITPVDWATDTNFTAGPDVGTPTKVMPSAPQRAQGFVPQTPASAQRVNAIINSHGQWIDYLSDRFPSAGVVDLDGTVQVRRTISPASIVPISGSAGGCTIGGGDSPYYELPTGGSAVLSLDAFVPPTATIDSIKVTRRSSQSRTGTDRSYWFWRQNAFDLSAVTMAGFPWSSTAYRFPDTDTTRRTSSAGVFARLMTPAGSDMRNNSMVFVGPASGTPDEIYAIEVLYTVTQVPL